MTLRVPIFTFDYLIHPWLFHPHLSPSLFFSPNSWFLPESQSLFYGFNYFPCICFLNMAQEEHHLGFLHLCLTSLRVRSFRVPSHGAQCHYFIISVVVVHVWGIAHWIYVPHFSKIQYVEGYFFGSVSWLAEAALQWTLGYMCHLEW